MGYVVSDWLEAGGERAAQREPDYATVAHDGKSAMLCGECNRS